MRQRHVARLCQSCQAPVGRQEERCWRCGAQWASEDEPRTRLRVMPGGAPAWADEGGTVLLEARARLRATTNRR
jgi:hypothetical protein